MVWKKQTKETVIGGEGRGTKRTGNGLKAVIVVVVDTGVIYL